MRCSERRRAVAVASAAPGGRRRWVVRRRPHAGRCEQEATETTEPDSILCFLSFLLLDWQSENYCVDHANYPDAFLSVSIREFFVPWQGRPSRLTRREWVGAVFGGIATS